MKPQQKFIRSSLARAGKKAMRRLHKFWRDEGWAEFGDGTYRPYFAAKNRAKLGRRDERRAFGNLLPHEDRLR